MKISMENFLSKHTVVVVVGVVLSFLYREESKTLNLFIIKFRKLRKCLTLIKLFLFSASFSHFRSSLSCLRWEEWVLPEKTINEEGKIRKINELKIFSFVLWNFKKIFTKIHVHWFYILFSVFFLNFPTKLH